MSLWIKICANTSLEDARLSAEAGADAVGFVFAPSKRRVTVEQVAAIVPHLPREIEKIGVFASGGAEEIAAAAAAAGLTGVQLHFNAPTELAAELRVRLRHGVSVIRTVHFAVGGPPPSLQGIEDDVNLDAILVDAKTETETGGTGQRFDWGVAANELFHKEKGRRPRIAAGGLTPENIAEAIAILKPWGVDVASGVEAAPGRKDPVKLHAFVRAARAAVGE